jgi:two-component system, NarL family, nitrate/nitrite response regulator NarL
MSCDPERMALRCLIVDDSTAFLETASRLLQREGVDVVGVASTGAEALERVDELEPEVILLDISLGAESGFDLAQRLAGDSRLPQTDVILISTHAEADFAEPIGASPAVGFLSKSELSARAIHHLLSRRQDGGPLRRA